MRALPLAAVAAMIAMATLALCAPPRATAADRALDAWFDDELLPYVTDQLTRHPRFKGETVMFVVLTENAQAPVSNALALSLRDRLLDAALRTPGITVGSRQGTARGPAADRIDCTRDDAHYYVGLEVATEIDGRHRVRVRALDLEDRGWVTGFGLDWRGRLTTVQLRALRESRVDESFRGAREAPFSAAEIDLLAARLAHDLGCALLRGPGGSYYVSGDSTGDDTLDGMVGLVGKNLASADVLELTSDDARVNATLAGEAHPVDGALYQYWVTVTPVGTDDGLESIGASAYVQLPGQRLAATPAIAAAPATSVVATHALPVASAGLLGTLRIATPSSATSCRDGSNLRRGSAFAQQGDCTLLSVDTHTDAIVFFLEHQAGHGLVRLGGPECRDRTAARVATAGRGTQLPIGATSYGTARTRPVGEWRTAPHTDTYYALAVTDARAARRFANLIDRLPLRCTGTMRPGLVGEDLRRWFDEFATLVAGHPGLVDWRAIEVNDVL